MVISQNLNFDVSRLFDVLFEVNGSIAKGRFGFGLGLLQGRFEYEVVGCDAHSFAATPSDRLNQYGEAHFDVARSSMPTTPSRLVRQTLRS